MSTSNYCVDEKREELFEKLPLKTPYGLTISTCNFCDFKCIYCELSKIKPLPRPRKLTMDLFNKLAEQLKEFGEPIRQISFVANGETILNEDLPEMIKKVKAERVADSVKIITNANRLTHEYSDRLIDAGLDVLKISLQGITAAKYSEVCKTNIDFDKFIEQIECFYRKKQQCKVHVKIIDIALDDGEEQKFYKLFENISDNSFIEKCQGELAIDKSSSNNKFRINMKDTQICTFPFYTFFVDDRGMVFPCCNVNEQTDGDDKAVGNILDKSLKEMWDDEFKKLQLSFLSHETPFLEVCRNCKRFTALGKDTDIIDGHEREILNRMFV